MIKIKVKTILAEPASFCQVRADIHFKTIIISINGCEYFKYNTCPQKYKQKAGTKNIHDHLFKYHGWRSLMIVQNKLKPENKIKNIVKHMRPAVER